jgi:hypothetical protein
VHGDEARAHLRLVLAGREPATAERPEEQPEPADEAPVADAVDDERLHAGGRLLVVLVPEADEQVAAEADALPAEEHHDEVVPEDEEQHREDEQVQVREEAPEGRLRLHVRRRVDVDERTDARDDEAHHGRERIHREREVRVDGADAEHLPGEAVEVAVPGLEADELGDVRERERERDRHGTHRDRRDAEAADVELLARLLAPAARLQATPEEGIRRGAEEREQGNPPQRQQRRLDVRDLAGEVGHRTPSLGAATERDQGRACKRFAARTN